MQTGLHWSGFLLLGWWIALFSCCLLFWQSGAVSKRAGAEFGGALYRQYVFAVCVYTSVQAVGLSEIMSCLLL